MVPTWLKGTAFKPLLGPRSPGLGGARQYSYSSASASPRLPACAALHSLCLSHFVSMYLSFCLQWFSSPTPAHVGSQPSGSDLLRDRSPENVKCSCAPLLGIFLFMICVLMFIISLLVFLYHLSVLCSLFSLASFELLSSLLKICSFY